MCITQGCIKVKMIPRVPAFSKIGTEREERIDMMKTKLEGETGLRGDSAKLSSLSSERNRAEMEGEMEMEREMKIYMEMEMERKWKWKRKLKWK